MFGRHLLLLSLLLAAWLAPQRSDAITLELALVIDGSGSISPGDWQLQLDAYQGVFQDNFYSKYIAPSPFDDIVVGAFIFSGGLEGEIDFGGGNVFEYSVTVFSYLDWVRLTNDAEAFAFGAQFEGLPQPGGTTATSAALEIATYGGLVSCPFVEYCSPLAPLSLPFQLTATGLLNNGFDGDVLVIDISTDGVPTEPFGNGAPNQADRDLAIATANAIRTQGIIINAIGVGDLVDDAFLEALVGLVPAATPTGFYVRADGFLEFDEALQAKLARETFIPAPPALPLLLTGVAAGWLWRRRRRA